LNSKVIKVAAGVIVRNGKILCVQKGPTKYDYTSFKFEFPGGKIDDDETAEEALKRELVEELGLEIEIMTDLGVYVHHYPDFSISLQGFLCKDDHNDPVLKEHIAIRWLNAYQLHLLDWAAADLPIIEAIQHKRIAV
jgi:8-oxo-dGTP diphosphatase